MRARVCVLREWFWELLTWRGVVRKTYENCSHVKLQIHLRTSKTRLYTILAAVRWKGTGFDLHSTEWHCACMYTKLQILTFAVFNMPAFLSGHLLCLKHTSPIVWNNAIQGNSSIQQMEMTRRNRCFISIKLFGFGFYIVLFVFANGNHVDYFCVFVYVCEYIFIGVCLDILRVCSCVKGINLLMCRYWFHYINCLTA